MPGTICILGRQQFKQISASMEFIFQCRVVVVRHSANQEVSFMMS